MSPLKKVKIIIITAIFGSVAGILISSLLYVTTGFSLFGQPAVRPPASEDIDNAQLVSLAFSVLDFIKDSDFDALSKIAHPDFGVVFSPSATITLSTNRRFNSEQIALFGSDNTIYVWGLNDVGEPIEHNPADYFAEFVFPSDYTTASVIGINRIVRTGNALENITDEFPGVRFVDFHIPGEDRDSTDDLDWSSLRLGFEEHAGCLWLTVIVRSTWTV